MLDHKRIAAAGVQTDCVFFSLESAPMGFFGYSAGKRTQEDFVPQSSVLFPKKSLSDEAAGVENTSDEGRTELKLECTQARGYRNSDMFAHYVNI